MSRSTDRCLAAVSVGCALKIIGAQLLMHGVHCWCVYAHIRECMCMCMRMYCRCVFGVFATVPALEAPCWWRPVGPTSAHCWWEMCRKTPHSPAHSSHPSSTHNAASPPVFLPISSSNPRSPPCFIKLSLFVFSHFLFIPSSLMSSQTAQTHYV